MRAAFLVRRVRAPAEVFLAIAAFWAIPCGDTWAQQGDRERAQLRQMQLQVQRLQSENSTLQNTLTETQARTKEETERSKKDAATTHHELAGLKAEAKSRAEELDRLKSTLAEAYQRLSSANAEIEQLRKTVAERDDSLRKASEAKRQDDAAAVLLGERLKAQTARGDFCETRHAGLFDFSSKLVARYESDRLRMCEPITGIWKVKQESEVQALRNDLYGYRLDAQSSEAGKR